MNKLEKDKYLRMVKEIGSKHDAGLVIRLSTELRKALEKEAKEKGLEFSAYIRMILYYR